MAAIVKYIAILTLIFLVVQPILADSDKLSPLLSPFLDKVCEEVKCGKGTCKVSTAFDFGYICECDDGWKHSRSDNEEDLKFLPCVIPNCTLDYSCTAAPPPVTSIKEPPMNKSFYDPCYYAYCGEGSCSRSTKNGYNCECKQGFNNLLNITQFPCYNQCVIGNDCSSLGITSSNSSKNSNSSSHASSSIPGSFVWFTLMTITVAMISQN